MKNISNNPHDCLDLKICRSTRSKNKFLISMYSNNIRPFQSDVIQYYHSPQMTDSLQEKEGQQGSSYVSSRGGVSEPRRRCFREA